MSVITLYGQLMRHQSPVRSRARSKYFYARAVHVQLHTRVFLKFKSSCTVSQNFSLHIQDPFSQIQSHIELIICHACNIIYTRTRTTKSLCTCTNMYINFVHCQKLMP